MKCTKSFKIYTIIFSLITITGYCLDTYLGIWRQALVGALLLISGIIVCSRLPHEGIKDDTTPSVGIDISATLILACSVLLTLMLRLITANILICLHANPKVPYAGAGFIVRLFGTVVLPTLFVCVLGFYILPKISAFKSKFGQYLCILMAYIPFCTSYVYLPSILFLSACIYLCERLQRGNYALNIFVSYSVLVFQDTFAVSIGSLDLNMRLLTTLGLLLVSCGVVLVISYLSLRIIKQKVWHIGEFLTVLLASLLLFIVGIAI